MDNEAKEFIKKLMTVFRESHVNIELELILMPRTNLYFGLKNVKTETDVKCKILEWCSRDATTTEPYGNDEMNKVYHNLILRRINTVLETTFNNEEMELIYDSLGNAINHNLTVKFVESGYDLELLK